MSRSLHGDRWALLAVTVAVLLANLPYLTGWVHADPLPVRSALASSVHQGPLGGAPTIDPNVGYSSQAIGHLAALDLLHLHLPWWNPYEATGMPLVGETQAGALFAPTLLTALSNGQLLERIVLELIAGWATFALLRRLGLLRLAAAAGAVVFALNGTFAWFAHAAINPVPFLPLLLLGIERAFTAAAEGRTGGWRVIAVAVALSLYAGFPEIAYIDGLLAVAWTGWRCGSLEPREIPGFIARVAAGVLTGLLLAAPMLVATANDLGHVDVGIHAGGQLAHHHLNPLAVPQTLLPYAYGPLNGAKNITPWVTIGGYVSALLLALALIGLLTRGRRGLKVVLAAFIALTFAHMAGAPPGLSDLIGFLPDMSNIEFYRYAWPALELAVIVLAAIGIDCISGGPEMRGRQMGAALAVAALTAGAALDAAPLARAVHARFGTFFVVSLVWAGLSLALVAGLAWLPRPRARAIALAGLIAVEALVLFALPELSAPRATTLDTAPVAYLRAHLGESRFFSLGPLGPNYGSYYGLATLDVNDFVPRAYGRYVTRRLDPIVKPDLFVGTYGGYRPLDSPSPGAELISHLAGYRAAAVRYVLAPAGWPLPESRRTLELVDRTRIAWIYRLNGAAAYFTARGCRVTSRDRDTARVACAGPSVLIRRETWFPGWQATLDGRPAHIRRIVAGLFQAVAVPAGTHVVTFAFAPPGIGWGGGALLAGCVALLIPTAWRRRGAAGRPVFASPQAARARTLPR